MLVGYMRISSDNDRQSTDLQRDALLAAGVDPRHLFEDHASGAKDDRVGLTQALEFVRSGDVLVVWKLDRLGRSLSHLLTIVNTLHERQVAFRSLTEGMDTTTPSGELYCADDPALYEKCLIRPVSQIDRQLIVSEKTNIDRFVATLGLKEMTQSTLIRKLCTYTTPNPTRRAIFEFDKLIRGIYTLRYLRDPQLERNVHRSQNRIESYHQLRSTIAQVGGKKELTGRTDLEIEISNQCARLIANAIIRGVPKLEGICVYNLFFVATLA